METQAIVKCIKGREITLKLSEDIVLPPYLKNEEGFHEGIFILKDPRGITQAQRGYIYMLFNDMVKYTGESIEYVKPYLKALFAYKMGWDDFSIGYNGISQHDAGEFIEFIIEYFFKEEIPFTHQKYYVGREHTRMLFIYLKYRKCFISGDKGEVAHYDAVGMGNNRKKIDHSTRRFMCLRHDYHELQHQMGIPEFCDKFKVLPIKLTPEQVKEFGI